MNRTPLYEAHRAAGARMMPFGGFEMPLQYAGIVAEHRAARVSAAIFDTCHMGEIRVHGPHAAQDLDRILSCHVATLSVGQCRYGLMCADDGGVLDDLIVYCLAPTEFLLVVNAGTRTADFDWLRAHLSYGQTAVDESDETCKIDLQGPAAPGIMRRLTDTDFSALRHFHWMHVAYRGRACMLSRTGYTGEIGFEFYSDAETALTFWNDCLALGATPAGLGARDTLRLEMGMPLCGHELRADLNAGWSGFDFAIARDKSFHGSDAVLDPARQSRRLTGFALEGRRAAREGDRVLASENRDIGFVTSGSFGPSLGHAVALGYVDISACVEGTPVQLAGSRGALTARITTPPFYRQATARAPMKRFLSTEDRT